MQMNAGLGFILVQRAGLFSTQPCVAYVEEFAISVVCRIKCTDMFYYIYSEVLNLIERLSLQGQKSSFEIYMWEHLCKASWDSVQEHLKKLD